jgi:hypothetical protein
MPAPAITASTRYTARGSTVVYWVVTIASQASPSRAELNAGTNLAPQMADAKGWSVKTNMVDAPDMSTRYTPTIPGAISADDSSLTMYMSKNGVDARALMPQDAVGFIVWLDGGDTAANKMDVFPVTVASHSKQRNADGANADTLMIAYAITALPSLNIAVP